MRIAFLLAGPALIACGSAFAGPPAPMNFEGTPGGVRYLEEGQPPAIVHPTVEAAQQAREHAIQRPEARPGGNTTSKQLVYRGGTGGIGVETASSQSVRAASSGIAFGSVRSWTANSKQAPFA